VCGGGIAGIEGLLRLRRLAGERIRLTLVSSGEALVYRPLAVREPFSGGGVPRYPIVRIAADTGTTWVKDQLAFVDLDARTVHTERGGQLSYDALLLAVGARETSPYEHALVFNGRNGKETFHAIVQDLDAGRAESIAFVLPHGLAWPLPLYELALMTAERARSVNVEPQLTFVTAEGRPLKAFGQAAGDAILRLLAEARIGLHTGVVARVPAPRLVTFGETQLEAERIITLPTITGPALKGIPAGTSWFVPIDERCVVQDATGCVFAAGDATDFPVKHGGIGAQQADTAAAGIAHLAGVCERPPPLEPVIRGMLMTGGRPLYVAAHVIAGLGWRSEVYERPPWPAEEKIVAEELGAYLSRLDLPAARP
jgi:sulfide:quinone oxidoreductase